MPYVPHVSTQNRIASATAVLAIEALLLLMLAKGLTMVVNRIEPDRNLSTRNYPEVKPVDAVPEPTGPVITQQTSRPTDQRAITLTSDFTDPGLAVVPTDLGKGPILEYVPPRRPTFPPRGARPLANQASWASADDYPPYDMRAGHQGTARYRLDVGASGQVTGCQITGSSGWPGLDAATCRLVAARARFSPASDESGAAVAGSYAGSIIWRVPEE